MHMLGFVIESPATHKMLPDLPRGRGGMGGGAAELQADMLEGY